MPHDVIPHDEVVVHLRRPDELFAVDPKALLHDPAAARTRPAADDLLDELLSRPRTRSAPHLVVTLPAGEVTEDTARRLTAALRCWCTQRIEQAERETRVLWHEGLRSLRSGIPLFVVGLVLSTRFLATDMPAFLQDWLGNGIFLVLAWVGLWYPLDLLVYARQPLRHEMRVLDAMTRLPIDVRPAPDGGDRPSADEPETGRNPVPGAMSPGRGAATRLAPALWSRRLFGRPVIQPARRRGLRGARRAR
jgi:hypothetical protein